MTFFGRRLTSSDPRKSRGLTPEKAKVDQLPSSADARAQRVGKPLFLPTVEEVLSKGDVTVSLAQISTFMRSFDARHRSGLHRALITLYAVAEHLRDDEDARLHFCRHPDWASVKRNRPRFDRPHLMLQHVLRFANGLNDQAGSKRASKQFRALGPLFEQTVPHAEIEKRLKASGGVDGLAQAHAKPRERQETTRLGARIVLNPGPQTSTLNEHKVGQQLLIHLKVTASKGGVVYADVMRAGRPKAAGTI